MDKQQQHGIEHARGSKLLLACLLMCGATWLTQSAAAQSQASSDSEAPAAPATAQVNSTPQQQQNAQIAVALNKKLTASNELRPLDLGVWVHDAGVVTLSGTVPTPALQEQAEAITRSVSGVQSVENKIVVGQTAQAANPAPTPQAAQQAPMQSGSMPQPSANGNDGAAPANGYPDAQRPLITAQGAPQEQEQEQQQQPAQGQMPAQAMRSQPMPYNQPSLTLGVETPLLVQVLQRLDSKHSKPGETFSGLLVESVYVNGMIALPRGTPVQGIVIDARPAGHLKGRPILALQIASVNVGDARYLPTTQPWMHEGRGKGDQTANNIVGGAAVGAFIGGGAGRGRGALLGAMLGGGAATGLTAMSSGPKIFVPAEAVITFRLAVPLTVRAPTVNEIRNAEENAPRMWRHRDGYPPPPPPGYQPGYPPIIQNSGPFPDDGPQ